MHTIMIQEKNIKMNFFKLSRDQKYVEKQIQTVNFKQIQLCEFDVKWYYNLEANSVSVFFFLFFVLPNH